MRRVQGLGVLLALVVLWPTAAGHSGQSLEAVSFDETIPAGAAVDGTPTSLSPHGNISVPEGAELAHVRMNWMPTPGTNPEIQLTILDGESTPFKNRTIAGTAGHDPLELTVPVEDIGLLGWRVRAHEGLAVDQYVEGVARFETVESQEDRPTSRPSTPADRAGQPAPGSPESAVSVEAVVAGVLAYVAILAWLRRLWDPLSGILVGLFSRISDDEVADHPERRRILDLLDREPGLHVGGLARRTDISESTIRHHLDKLEDANLVVRWKTDGYVCHFLQGSAGDREKEALARLRSSTARTILAALDDDPPASQRGLARVMDLAPSTVSYHLSRLVTVDLVRTTGDGGAPELTDFGRRILDLVEQG